MYWKYGKLTTVCSCDKWNEKEITFTTLCPMFNPITAEDYRIYHENIDFVQKKINFDNFHILLYSHSNISKEDLQKRLPTETII